MNQRRAMFYVFSFVSRLISRVFENWKLVLLIIFLVSPVGPHMRWEYTYVGDSGYPRYVHCTYLGARGLVHINPVSGDCPFITIINAKEGRPL